MIRQLPFLLGRVFNTPLLVSPAKLDAFMLALPGLMERPDVVQAFDHDDDRPEPEPQARRAGYAIRNGVATIPIHGVLVRRAGQIDTNSDPLQSYEQIGTSLRRAMSDSRVRAVMLDVDSPGGEAGGVMDLARDIRAAGQSKPIWAVANDDSMSAAYALASAAQRVWVTRSGGVGSIGTVALHRDQSGFDKQQGFVFNYVHAGKRKVDANPHEPLSAEARARIQQEVDRMQGMFVESVALHRGMSPDAVRATEAGQFFGEEGIHAGLADQLGTFGEAHAALSASISNSTRRIAAMSDRPNPDDPNPAPEPQPDPQPTPQQDPQPDPPPNRDVSASAEIIRLAARNEATARSAEITELCVLAGFAGDASGFIRSDMTLEQVRRRLIAKKAEQPAADPVRPIDPTTPQASPAAGFKADDAWSNFYPQQRRN